MQGESEKGAIAEVDFLCMEGLAGQTSEKLSDCRKAICGGLS